MANVPLQFFFMYVGPGCVAQSLPTDRTTPVRLSNTFVQDL